MVKIRKCIICIMLAILLLFIGEKVQAAGISIKASSLSVTEGDNVTITISSQYTGRINISATGGTLSEDKVWIEGDSKTVTLKTTNSGNITITASPNGKLSDSSGGKVDASSASVTVKVNAKNTTNNNSNNKTTDNNKTKNSETSTSNNTAGNTTNTEPTFKSSNDTLYATGDINIRKSYSTDSDIIGNLQKGESITRTGIGDNGWSKVSYNGSTGYIKTSLLTTEEPSKSSDKALKTLEITPEGLDPEFDPEVTTYTLEVGADVEKLDIKAAPNDENATVEISGNDSLNPGDNVVKITVTAPDETIRTYTINVKKQESAKLSLTSIKVNGYTLSPTFSSNVYEYKLNILDPSITKLDITAVANDENANIEISGNNDLKDGENTIVITVTSEDGKEKVIYQICVNKTPMAAGTTKKSNTTLYIGIGIIAIIIIIIIIIIIKSRKNKKSSEDEEISDDYSDLYGYSSKSSKDLVNESENLDNKIQDNTEENLYDSKSSDIDNEKKNEDSFNYNPYVSKDIYGDYNNKEEESSYKDLFGTINGVDEFSKEQSANSNISYNDSLSENVNEYKITNKENTSEDKPIDTPKSYSNNSTYLNDIESEQDNDYTLDENYKIRRSKGKHSK